MSDLMSLIQDQVYPALDNLTDGLADDFLDGLGEILNDAPTAAKAKVASLVREGFAFKRKALTAETPETARTYADAVEKTQRRVKTVLLAEKLVAEESMAALVSDLFGKALSGLQSITVGLVETIVSGLAKGAISGLMGGEGGGESGGLSSVFPFVK